MHIYHASALKRLQQGLDLYAICNDDYEELGVELGAGGTCTQYLLYKVTAGTVDGNATGSYFVSDGTETTDASNRCKPVQAGDVSGNDKHLDIYKMTWANGPDGESNGSLDNDFGYMEHPDGSGAMGTGARTVMMQLYVDEWYDGRTSYPAILFDGKASCYLTEPDTGGSDEGSADDELVCTGSGGPPLVSASASNWARGNWSWAWMRRDASGGHSIGRDATEMASGTIDSPEAGTEALKFGGQDTVVKQHIAINGKIARILMYDRQLSNWEILAIQQGLLDRALGVSS